MTFDEIWDQLCKKRPDLEDGTTVVEFTAENLRRLLRQVYDQGRDSAPAPLGNIFGGLR